MPKKSRRLRKLMLIFGLFVFSGILFASASALMLYLYFSRDLPSVEQISSRHVSESTKIYDRTGKILLYEISGGEKRTVIPLAEIPQHLKDATIAVEDEHFYSSGTGLDLRAIARALLANIRHGRIVQGGSTIPQQLAKNAFLSPEQTITRKIREAILAFELHRHYPKDRILELYLNQIPYGPTLYGVEAASQAYFNKSAKDLTLPESAVLAALPKAPSYYSPWGSHVKELLERQKFVLRRMRELGVVSDEALEAAMLERVVFEPQKSGIRAPHFVIEVQDYLVKKYGEDLVRSGGLRVLTTLDWDLQQIAERVVLEGAKRNEELYGGTNAALVAEDTATGQILALAGSRDYFDSAREGNFNVATQGLRQPGSALKPFAYLAAFEKGYRPETVLFDVPVEFVPQEPECPPIPVFTNENPRCFHPQNFDEKFRGPVTLREALAQSINIPAVKVLYLAGLERALSTLRDFGITTLDDPRRYGLSLVLGGGEVTLLELVGAYGALAEDGIAHNQAFVLEVVDRNGRVLEVYEDEPREAARAEYVRLITDILADADARAGLFGGSLPLTVFPGHSVALKTGTSNDYRDAWTVGYTPSLAVGVWAGNNNNAPMHKRGSSILAALPLWHEFMKEALERRPEESFVPPPLEPASSPILAGDYAPNGELHSILFHVDRENPTGAPPSDPATDPQFYNWELALLSWAKDNFGSLPMVSSSPQWTGALPLVTVESPAHGAGATQSTIPVWARITSLVPLRRVTARFNGERVYETAIALTTSYELLFSFIPPNLLSQNTLDIEAEDVLGMVGRKQIILFR